DQRGETCRRADRERSARARQSHGRVARAGRWSRLRPGGGCRARGGRSGRSASGPASHAGARGPARRLGRGRVAGRGGDHDHGPLSRAPRVARMPRIRVLIADDHAVLRAGLKLLIKAQADMEVVGEAGDGAATVRSAQATTPHVVLLDLSMPGSRFTHTIEQLGRVAPSSRVLVLTMHDDSAYLQAALQAGASGYIVKKSADVELLTAI